MTKETSVATQLGRVIAVICDGKQVWWYRLTPATSRAAQEATA